MQKSLNNSKVLDGIEYFLGWGVAVSLFSMMLLTFCDVIGRKFIGSSITGVVEVSELLMLTLIFTGLPLCSLRSEHVIFDLLDKFLPRFLAKFQNFLAQAICFALLAGGAWLVVERAVRTMEQGDITAQLLIPMGPFYLGTALMLAITAFVHLYLAFRPVQDDDTEIKAGAL